LDLNGHTISRGVQVYTVGVYSSAPDVTIRNGNFYDFENGVCLASPRNTVQDISVNNSWVGGITVGADNCTLSNSSCNVGGTGWGIIVNTSNTRIQNCNTQDEAGIGFRILDGKYNLIDSCVATNAFSLDTVSCGAQVLGSINTILNSQFYNVLSGSDTNFFIDSTLGSEERYRGEPKLTRFFTYASKVVDRFGNPIRGNATVEVYDPRNQLVHRSTVNHEGRTSVELMDYVLNQGQKTQYGPYTRIVAFSNGVKDTKAIANPNQVGPLEEVVQQK
jgi:hypothetical protein